MAAASHVVIVGGHPVITGVLTLACEAQPGLVIVGGAPDGSSAAAVVAITRPDIVVLDLDLPDVDGLEVLSRLRMDGYEGSILVLSDRTEGAVVLEAMRLGAGGFLTKTDGLRHVGSVVRRVLAGEKVVDDTLEQAAADELGRFARQAREGAELEASLTSREHEILALLSDGLTVRQIGRRLGISARTVETHVAKLYRKLGARTRVQAVARAAYLGLIDLRS